MKSYSDSRTLPKGLTPDEFVSLMKAIPKEDRISKLSFYLAFNAGLRISEIVGGKRKNGDDIEPLKRVNVLKDQINIWDAKGGVDRVVPKPKGWKDWMRSMLPIPRSARTLERNFKKYAKKANLPEHYVFHSLRHGFGLRAADAGIPVHQIQLLMGHSSLAVTNIYTRARPKDAIKSYEELF